MDEIQIHSQKRNQMIDITDRLRAIVRQWSVREGAVVLQSLHTTAALTINENADPAVPQDILAKLENLFPQKETFYRHAEGNSDSHLKASALGPSLTVLIHDGDLVLGAWQGVFFCEFDGPRTRRVAVQVLRAPQDGA
ncbi:MAG: secondary thiamine-phosphate synthase enzyme YjbQ [Nitrospinota bacterium]